MKKRYYSPQISRLLVCALYHEAKARRQPMTALVNELLTLSLRPTSSYVLAESTHGFQQPLLVAKEHARRSAPIAERP